MISFINLKDVVEIVRKKFVPPPPSAPPPDIMLASFKGANTKAGGAFTGPRAAESKGDENSNQNDGNGRGPQSSRRGVSPPRASSSVSAPAKSPKGKDNSNYSDDEDYEAGSRSSNNRRGDKESYNAPSDTSRDTKPIQSSGPRPKSDALLAEPKPKQSMGRSMFVATPQGFLDYSPVLNFTYRDLKSFINTPIDKGITARCYIERNRSGSNFLAPVYSLCADLEDGTGREMIVCKKVLNSLSAHYVFSLKEEDLSRKREQRSKLYLGKLRGTESILTGKSNNEFILYDYGNLSMPTGLHRSDKSSKDDDSKPNTAAEMEALSENSLYRKELMVAYYNTKKRPNPTPDKVRASEICISNPEFEEQIPILSNAFAKIREDGTQNAAQTKPYLILHERTSRYDPLSSCLVDFKGRGNTPSVKNAQFLESTPMVDQLASKSKDPEGKWILQVAKFTPECFNMDFRYPLSMFQAFAICISRFDADLTW